jgi:hypothetical protein
MYERGAKVSKMCIKKQAKATTIMADYLKKNA